MRLSPDEHDRAVARTSHLPHLLASLVAGRLAEAPPEHLALSGQGVRDVTRVAAGDPELWQQIVTANAPAVLDLLGEVRDQLDDADRGRVPGQARRADRDPGPGRGRHAGHPRQARRPDRGRRPRSSSRCPTEPGELARLFADAGASGVNIEDVRIDHDPGRPVGLVELVVEEDRGEHLLVSLESRGWVTHR